MSTRFDMSYAVKMGSYEKQAFNPFRAMYQGGSRAVAKGSLARAKGSIQGLKGMPNRNPLQNHQLNKARLDRGFAQQSLQGLPAKGGFFDRLGYGGARVLRPFATSRRWNGFAGRVPNNAFMRYGGKYAPEVALGGTAWLHGNTRGQSTGAGKAIAAMEDRPFYEHLAYGLAGPLGLRPMLTDFGINRAKARWSKEHPWTGWAVGPDFDRIQNEVQQARGGYA